MSNKFYTENKQLGRYGSTKPRPPVGHGSGPTPTVNGADDPPYNANIGPGGPDLNTVGFPRVRAYMKSKMSPEQDASGEIVDIIGREFTPTGLAEKLKNYIDPYLNGPSKKTPVIKGNRDQQQRLDDAKTEQRKRESTMKEY